MQQSQLLTIARQGVKAWNAWRQQNPHEKVDFSGVDLVSWHQCFCLKYQQKISASINSKDI